MPDLESENLRNVDVKSQTHTDPENKDPIELQTKLETLVTVYMKMMFVTSYSYSFYY